MPGESGSVRENGQMLGFFRDVYFVLTGRDQFGDKVRFAGASNLEVRAAAARFSRGNIAIQQGAFVTTDDLEREREQFKRHQLK